MGKGPLNYAPCLARPRPLYRPLVGAPPPGAPSVVSPPSPLLTKLPILYTLPRVAVLRSFGLALPSLSFSLPLADAPCPLSSTLESVRTRLAFRSSALCRTTSVAAPAPGFSSRGTAHPPATHQDIGYRPRYCPPRPLRLMVWACLDRPWSLPPPEPRVRPLVGHFRLASKGN